MTESSFSQASPPQTPPHSTPRRSLWATLLLGSALSVLLVIGWLTYLILTPPPAPPAAPAGASHAAAAGGFRILTPRGAIAADVLQQFEDSSGFAVATDAFDRDDQAVRVLESSSVDYDAAIVSGVAVARLAADHRLAALSPAHIPNAGDLVPMFVTVGATYDPGNRHSLVYAARALGLAYDVAKISQRLGDDAEVPSWQWLFNPDLAAKLADCGIQVSDDAAEGFAAALAALDLPIRSRNVADYEAASKQWEKARGFIGKFGDDDVVDALATGRVCLAVTSSAAAYRAETAARRTNADAIAFAVPKEGSVARYGFLVIPANAHNPANAELLFSYLLRPDIAARVSADRGILTAASRALVLLPTDLRTDPALDFPRTAGARLVSEFDPGPELSGLRERFWHLIDAPAQSTPVP